MDKAVSHTLLSAAGIGQAKYLRFYSTTDYERPSARTKSRWNGVVSELELGYPVFVKPANAGSSVGVSKVTRARWSSDGAVAKALRTRTGKRRDQRNAVDGQEVECAVLGNDRPHCLGGGRDRAGDADAFYDYEAKYITG